MTDHPYIYTGFAFTNRMFLSDADFAALESEGDELAEEIEAEPDRVDEDWELEAGTFGGHTTVYRLREGVERFFVSDINNPASSSQAQSTIPVMWDVLADEASHFNHVPGGCNVLYMDGHVTFIKYVGPRGADFPVNEGGLVLHELAHTDLDD